MLKFKNVFDNRYMYPYNSKFSIHVICILQENPLVLTGDKDFILVEIGVQHL